MLYKRVSVNCELSDNVKRFVSEVHGQQHDGDASGRSKQSRDVFKSPTSNTDVIFWEANIEDLSSQLWTQAAEQFKAPDLSHMIYKPKSSAVAQDDEDADETGVEPKDIELVMTQAEVSRSKAVKALKAANGDI
ncbi:hypothetical protein TIFTF001_028340 [Ficus carica]|uniref:Nascent polypeptide-associated complex subunit alpha-like UBA domain-containing protein n=1 Tax=Ficus carica TaxID=3494 RepID=A0AA88J1D3_FICCA|nr:hypothetical protein TIFTF001_028340 [Ficus carica]